MSVDWLLERWRDVLIDCHRNFAGTQNEFDRDLARAKIERALTIERLDSVEQVVDIMEDAIRSARNRPLGLADQPA